MDAIFRLLATSTGKKVQMALTGFLLCGFLAAHLAGNLLLFVGPEAFNRYAEAIEHNPLLPVAEIGLLALFLLHIATAAWVSVQARKVRPVPYVESAAAGGKTLGSSTMVISGLLLIIFLVVHIKTFRFAPDRTNLYGLVMEWFQSRPYALFYVAAMAALGLHLSHGFQSAFQTLGLRHPRYTPAIRLAGLGFAVVVTAGFASIPLWATFIK